MCKIILECDVFAAVSFNGQIEGSCSTGLVSSIQQACAAEMAVRYAALSACGKVHVCHFNSLGGAT